jgi:DNA-binding CsgD family transcriptional regulator
MSKHALHKGVRAHSEARGAASRASAGLIAAVSFHDSPLPCEVLLARLFALTPAEARLARCLSKGDTLKEAAMALKIKLSTVRSQLSSLFAKTGTRRQSQLVALLVRVAHLEDQRPALRAKG